MEGLAMNSFCDEKKAPRKERVLVTGALGYIGSVLMGELLSRGYDAVGLDAGFYENELLFHDDHDRPPVLMRDVRDIRVEELQGFDVVAHLGELSNDPLCGLSDMTTFDINYRGSSSLAHKAKTAGVKRFIYSSSCSVYGVANGEEIMTEDSPTNPQTAYASCKRLVERNVRSLTSSTFTPVFLRNATAFGASRSMRFDVVLNNLAGQAWAKKKIAMTSDGTPWRPLVHVRDICAAMIAAIEADSHRVAGEIFNVGCNEQNYRVREIGEIVSKEFPDCEVSFGTKDSDNRSYRVSFDKINKYLPEFRCAWDAQRGARELRQVFERIAMDDITFTARSFTRLSRLRQLVDSGQVDSTLRWRAFHPLPASTEAPSLSAV